MGSPSLLWSAILVEEFPISLNLQYSNMNLTFIPFVLKRTLLCMLGCSTWWPEAHCDGRHSLFPLLSSLGHFQQSFLSTSGMSSNPSKNSFPNIHFWCSTNSGRGSIDLCDNYSSCPDGRFFSFKSFLACSWLFLDH